MTTVRSVFSKVVDRECLTSFFLPLTVLTLPEEVSAHLHSNVFPVSDLSVEVERVWSQPLTFASLLFYINRYVTHCQFIILQVGT